MQRLVWLVITRSKNKTHYLTMMMMMMIGIKTGTMASVIQGTVRPRGTCGRRALPRAFPRPPNLRM